MVYLFLSVVGNYGELEFDESKREKWGGVGGTEAGCIDSQLTQ